MPKQSLVTLDSYFTSHIRCDASPTSPQDICSFFSNFFFLFLFTFSPARDRTMLLQKFWWLMDRRRLIIITPLLLTHTVMSLTFLWSSLPSFGNCTHRFPAMNTPSFDKGKCKSLLQRKKQIKKYGKKKEWKSLLAEGNFGNLNGLERFRDAFVLGWPLEPYL